MRLVESMVFILDEVGGVDGLHLQRSMSACPGCHSGSHLTAWTPVGAARLPPAGSSVVGIVLQVRKTTSSTEAPSLKRWLCRAGSCEDSGWSPIH